MAMTQSLSEDAVTWKIVGEKGAGAKINRSISQMRVSSTAGVAQWRVWLTAALPLRTPAEAALLPEAERSVYVLNATKTPEDPHINFAIVDY